LELTESQVVNEWISQGEARGRLAERRQSVVRLLTKRFPGAVPYDVIRLINEQESLELLDDWFDTAADYTTASARGTIRRLIALPWRWRTP
jgi:hypothetical protein